MPPQDQTDWFAANAPKAATSAPASDDWFAQNAPKSSTEDPTRALSKATTIKAQPKPFSSAWFKEGAWRGASATADILPPAGATMGAVIGGGGGTVVPGAGNVAGATGGAVVGGMSGEAARQLLRRWLGYGGPSSSREAALDISKEGALQGGMQLGSELLPFAAPALKNRALTQYGKALGPTTREAKAITQDIVPGLIKRGERGSLETLAARAEENISDIQPRLDAAYQATSPAKTLGSGPTILHDLENLKDRYIVKGKVANPIAVNAISGVQDIVQQYGRDIDPDSLRKLKQIFDDPVAAQGGYAGADLSTKYTLKAQKAAADSIRKIMGKANPDVAALNKEISFWLNVQDVTSASILRKTGQAGGLSTVLSPLASGAVASATGAGLGAKKGLESGIGTTLTVLAYQAMRSPRWNTASAILKDRFATSLAKGNVGDALVLLGRLGVAAPEIRKSVSEPAPQRAQ